MEIHLKRTLGKILEELIGKYLKEAREKFPNEHLKKKKTAEKTLIDLKIESLD